MSDDKKRKFKIAPELQKAIDEEKSKKTKVKEFLKKAIAKHREKKKSIKDKLEQMLETRKAYSDSIRDFGSGEASWMFKSQVKHYVDLLANLDKEANTMGYKYSYVRGKYIPIKKSKPE